MYAKYSTTMSKAYASIGAIDKGKQIHEEIVVGVLLLHGNVLCSNALFDTCMPNVDYLQRQGKCSKTFLFKTWSLGQH